MDLELVVRRLVRKYKTSCPLALAKNLNVEVSREYLGKATKGIYYRKLRRRYIVVHEDLPDSWMRLVVAHELGHDQLHKGLGYYFIERNTLFNPGRFERQANRFAVLLLTYGDEIGPGETAELVCVRNGVPAEMAEYLY